MSKETGSNKPPLSIHFCAFLSLVLGLWIGWQSVSSPGIQESPSLPVWFNIAKAVAYIACFFGLRKHKPWAWVLFLTLVTYLLMHHLLAAYVFGFRLIQGNIFTIGYEITLGSSLLAIAILLVVAMRVLTKPIQVDNFLRGFSRSGKELVHLITSSPMVLNHERIPAIL